MASENPLSTVFFSRSFFVMMGTLCSLFCLTVPVPAISISESQSRSGKDVKRLSKKTSLPLASSAYKKNLRFLFKKKITVPVPVRYTVFIERYGTGTKFFNKWEFFIQNNYSTGTVFIDRYRYGIGTKLFNKWAFLFKQKLQYPVPERYL